MLINRIKRDLCVKTSPADKSTNVMARIRTERNKKKQRLPTSIHASISPANITGFF